MSIISLFGAMLSNGAGDFSFSSATYSVGEGDGIIAITINRLGGTSGAVTVDFRTRTFDGYGDADWQSDYDTINWFAVEFADGEASQDVNVTINDDGDEENDETFSVLLGNPTGGAGLGAIIQATVTIVDNDSALRIFPAAQGFGAMIVAGRGGQVIKVTNLNASGSGSFKAAIESSGARTIVFEVGGEIALAGQLWINNPYITIAGQTAPSPGITISGAGLRIPTYEVLIQHIAVRHTSESITDCIDVRYNGADIPYNVVIDHVSVTWGTDENVSFAPGGGNERFDHNITFSNILNAEGIGGYGTLISDGTRRLSLIGNLVMSNRERQPRIKGGVDLNMVNCVSYNIDTADFSIVGSTYAENFVTYVGNQFIEGPDTPSTHYAISATNDMVSGSEVYIDDNVSTGSMTNSEMAQYLVEVMPIPLTHITAMASNLVEDFVLDNVGSRPDDRDVVDQRLISEVIARTGARKYGTQTVPELEETNRTFDIPANQDEDSGNGYTNLEILLHQYSAHVETGAPLP